MVTVAVARRVLERESAHLRRLPFEDLAHMAVSQAKNPDVGCRFEDHPDGQLFIETSLGRLGIFRPRICVEITVTAENSESWSEIPCDYFERSSSSTLSLPETRSWTTNLIKCAFPLSIVVGVLYVMWLFLG